MAETKVAKSSDVVGKKDFLRRYLEEKRCAMTRELAEASGIDRTTLRKLLAQLEREGAVKRRKVGRVVLWCVP